MHLNLGCLGLCQRNQPGVIWLILAHCHVRTRREAGMPRGKVLHHLGKWQGSKLVTQCFNFSAPPPTHTSIFLVHCSSIILIQAHPPCKTAVERHNIFTQGPKIPKPLRVSTGMASAAKRWGLGCGHRPTVPQPASTLMDQM